MQILTHNSILYTIETLLDIAGVDRRVTSIDIRPDFSSVIVIFFGKKIELPIIDEKQIASLLKGTLVMSNIGSVVGKHTVPIVFKFDNRNFASTKEDVLLVHADILTLSFIMLSRYEERLCVEKDQFGRYKYCNSLACKYDFIDIPLVDEYALLLRRSIMAFIPDMQIIKRRWKAIPTHDVDELLRFHSGFKVLKSIIGGDLLARRSLSIACRSIRSLWSVIWQKQRDPFVFAIEKLIELSSLNGLCSEFYFKGLHKGEEDYTYDIRHSQAKFCMEAIKNANMTVGFHGGLSSYNDMETWRKERNRVSLASEQGVSIARQHYLKFDVFNTLRVWEESKLEIDSSLGYAEREGFRCGTCHEYFLFDIEKDRVSTVKERPLILMDGTLFSYRNMGIAQAKERFGVLFQRCRDVEGNFVFLWHNANTDRDYRERFEEVYVWFLNEVCSAEKRN